MAILDIGFPTGHSINQDQSNFTPEDKPSIVKRAEIENDSIKIYLDSVTNRWQCVKVDFKKDEGIKVEKRQKRVIAVSDYYQENVRRSKPVF